MIRLTGKRRYRVSDDGKVILQVQEGRYFSNSYGFLPVPNSDKSWRDACLEDLSEHDVK